MLKKSDSTEKLFGIDYMFEPIKGITFGDHWNGFEVPYFNKENAEKLVAVTNAATNEFGGGPLLRWDGENIIETEIGANEGDHSNMYRPVEIDGEKFWCIGGYYWTWASFEEGEYEEYINSKK